MPLDMRVHAIRGCGFYVGMRAQRGIACEQITQIKINKSHPNEHRDDASESVVRLVSANGRRTRPGCVGMLGV